MDADTLYRPTDVFSDGTRLYVADSYNHRVLIWNTTTPVTGQAADSVLGQDDFVTSFYNKGVDVSTSTLFEPVAVYSDGSQVYVADRSNNRVLIWSTTTPANGADADIVIGQVDFLSNVGLGTVDNATMYEVSGITVFDGKLFVSDSRYSRVLVWNTTTPTSGQGAYAVIGSGNYESSGGYDISSTTFSNTFGLSVTSEFVYVADKGHNRVLQFPLASVVFTSSNPNAIYFYSESSADWQDLGNWWNDEAHTDPAASLPDADSEVFIVSGSVVPEVRMDTDEGTSWWTDPVSINAGDVGIIFYNLLGQYNYGFDTGISGTTTVRGSIESSGILTGTVIFEDGGQNGLDGTVIGAATFYDSSINAGLVTGTSTFYDNSTNRGTAVIDGNAFFYDSSYHYNGSVVTGDAYFGCSTTNEGTVNGRITNGSCTYYFYSTNHAGWDLVENWWYDVDHTDQALGLPPSDADVITVAGSVVPEVNLDIWAQPESIDARETGIIFDSADNGALYYMTVLGDATFNGSSYPIYTIIIGDVTMNTTHYHVSAPTGGLFTFSLDSWIAGSLTDDSEVRIMYGSDSEPITDFVFTTGTYNYGFLSGTSTFQSDSHNQYLVTGTGRFYDESENEGTVYGNAVFLENSVNTKDGIVEGDACFAETATNLGTVTGVVTVGNCDVVEEESEPEVPVVHHGGGGGYLFTKKSVVIPTWNANTSTDSSVQSNTLVKFNRGKSTTTQRSIPLQFSIVDGDRVFVSESSDFGTALSRPYKKGMRFVLSSTPGPKTVYVKVVAKSGMSYYASGIVTYTPRKKSISTSVDVPASSYVFTLFLSRGSSGTEVLELQKNLQSLGFLPSTITPNGVFGPATQAAVQAFQKANGIDPLGYVGPATRAVLSR